MKITIDNFNSDIFGKKMGNIQYSDNISDIDVQNLNNFDFEHLTVKVPTYKKEIVNKFLANGFILADTLIRYQLNLNNYSSKKINHRCGVRSYKSTDLEELKRIAGESFTIDRFHTDKTLSNDDCDLYYQKWIENSSNGFADIVLVAEYNGRPVGFTTGKIGDDDVTLVLSAVDKDSRGLGVYTSMIDSGIKWALKTNQQKLIVGTQIDNVAVQKAWIRLGFTVLDSSYVLQRGF